MLEEKIRQLGFDGQDSRPSGWSCSRSAEANGELARLQSLSNEFAAAFELPWPWGGEWFELRDIRPLNYIIGPIGSGKTRFAMRLAEKLPNAAFLGLERSKDGMDIEARLNADATLKSRTDQTLAWLVDEGAAESDELIALIVGLETDGPSILVVDIVEQGLDQA